MLPYRRARAVLHTVKDQYWYVGPVSEKKAEELLDNFRETPGMFLLRDSLLPDADFFLSLLAHHSDIHHYPVYLRMDCSCAINGYTFDDLPACIDFYTENRLAGVFLQPPTFPLFNLVGPPKAHIQPTIRMATPHRLYNPRITCRPMLVPIKDQEEEKKEGEKDKKRDYSQDLTATSYVRDCTYESMEEYEIESYYESQLVKPNDHIYDSLTSHTEANEPTGGEEEQKEKRQGVTVNIAEEERERDGDSLVSCDGGQHSIVHVIEKGVVYSIPNKSTKKNSHLVATPDAHFVPRHCSTRKHDNSREPVAGIVQQMTKKLEALPTQYTVVPQSHPTRHMQVTNTASVTRTPPTARQDHTPRRQPPPPPPPPPPTTPSRFKRNINEQPPRRGSVKNLLVRQTQVLPTPVIMAATPKRAASWSAADKQAVVEMSYKRPSSGTPKTKKSKKNLLKRFFRLK